MHDVGVGLTVTYLLDHFINLPSNDYPLQVEVFNKLSSIGELSRIHMANRIRLKYQALLTSNYHVLHAVLKSSKSKDTSRNRARKTKKDDGEGKCFSCGELRHYANACPQNVCSLCGSVGHVLIRPVLQISQCQQ